MRLLLLSTFVALPLITQGSEWVEVAYRNIPPNRVVVGDGHMTLVVDRSAGAMVGRLAVPVVVVGVTATGVVSGLLETTPAQQGSRGHDDFQLRVGLVEAGSRRPGAIERRLAPRWVRQLMALAPPGRGVEQVRLFNLGLDASQLGWERRHPLSDLLVERVVAVPDESGRFRMEVTVDPVEVLGVWIGADGDDTASAFSVRVDHLALRLADGEPADPRTRRP